MYSSSSSVASASSGGPLLTTSMAHRTKASICGSLGLSRSSHISSARARCGPEKRHASVNARGTCFAVGEELLERFSVKQRSLGDAVTNLLTDACHPFSVLGVGRDPGGVYTHASPQGCLSDPSIKLTQAAGRNALSEQARGFFEQLPELLDSATALQGRRPTPTDRGPTHRPKATPPLWVRRGGFSRSDSSILHAIDRSHYPPKAACSTPGSRPDRAADRRSGKEAAMASSSSGKRWP
jgi:hypothetical protein